ncbi:MAG: glycerol-3-phosphate dehydrogenase [Rhodospirillales bacterium]|nr:glycerol-3-phosphate dehydrogenase [Rhodospirillales bacterium]
MTNKAHYDLCVIGGGINGAGIARDAAGRGLSVLLVEARDLACATSSASSKMIHGGLRYLEHYEFKLVREALQEREIFLRTAPHLIRPMEFVIPHEVTMRPAWMIRAGLFLYDHLARRRAFKGSRKIKASASSDLTEPLENKYKTAFVYSDGQVDDSRLVVLNAVDAAERHATILTRTICEAITPLSDHWKIGLHDTLKDRHFEISARTIVNAAGPWVRTILDPAGLALPDTPNVRLVKGSHIIIPRLYKGDHGYLLQQPDGRVVFTWPYQDNTTLIGTTEVDYSGDPYESTIDDNEISYLCQAVNNSFKNKIDSNRILFSFSGVRPLFNDGTQNASAVTRDYKIHLLQKDNLRLYSIFGGKITTYRHLAADMVNRLTDTESWTAASPLPGGDIKEADFNHFVEEQKERYDWCPHDIIERYARAYGTRMNILLERAAEGRNMGFHFGDHLFEAEVRYLIDHEFARTAEDILWRRSKLGMHAGDQTVKNLEEYLSKEPAT